MLKSIKTIILSLSLVLFFVIPVEILLASTTNQSPTEIIIKEGGHQGNNPRQESYVPISAYVISNTIYLTFSNDLGEIFAHN